MECPAVDTPARCEIRAVIRFLHAKITIAAEMHCKLRVYATVYGQNIMSEGTVRQWCRMFRDGQEMFMMKSEVVGRV
jgi:hypothetical protein